MMPQMAPLRRAPTGRGEPGGWGQVGNVDEYIGDGQNNDMFNSWPIAIVGGGHFVWRSSGAPTEGDVGVRVYPSVRDHRKSRRGGETKSVRSIRRIQIDPNGAKGSSDARTIPRRRGLA